MQVVWIVLLSIVGLIVAYFLFLFIASLFVDTKREYKVVSRFYQALCAGIGYWLLFFARVHTTVEGRELLPEGRFLLVGNHKSNFDPIVTWIALRKCGLAYISKPENFNIPLLGRLIRPCGFLPLDRENAKNAIQTINAAADLLTSDQASVGIYPEGTRNKTDEPLLPFHNGAFKIAQKAKVPIVVAALTNTADVAKNWPWHRTNVSLKILAVFTPEQVKALRTADIGDQVRTMLLEAITDK